MILGLDISTTMVGVAVIDNGDLVRSEAWDISKYEIKTMSFAVIQTGGKQYKVSTSEILKIERINNQEGKTVEFKNVLFLNDDKTTEIGNPNIQGAKVEATILKNTKNYLNSRQI